MKSVFVVECGEQNEGGGVVSVHRTREGAIKMAMACRMSYPERGWFQCEIGEDYWENGCDYVLVKEKQLQE